MYITKITPDDEDFDYSIIEFENKLKVTMQNSMMVVLFKPKLLMVI